MSAATGSDVKHRSRLPTEGAQRAAARVAAHEPPADPDPTGVLENDARDVSSAADGAITI